MFPDLDSLLVAYPTPLFVAWIPIPDSYPEAYRFTPAANRSTARGLGSFYTDWSTGRTYKC